MWEVRHLWFGCVGGCAISRKLENSGTQGGACFTWCPKMHLEVPEVVAFMGALGKFTASASRSAMRWHRRFRYSASKAVSYWSELPTLVMPHCSWGCCLSHSAASSLYKLVLPIGGLCYPHACTCEKSLCPSSQTTATLYSFTSNVRTSQSQLRSGFSMETLMPCCQHIYKSRTPHR